jgi:ribosomal protein S18 acetylase RimI-like enzyme
MIRPMTPDDAAGLIPLVVAAGMFPADETEILDKMLADYFDGKIDEGHTCIVDEQEGKLIGVAYYEPAPATDGTWYVTMIAVHPDYQGQGRGAALLRHVENALQASGQRVLLIETSATPTYAGTRKFYAKCGYQEEARIRDYWAAGDDMIVFRKELNAG